MFIPSCFLYQLTKGEGGLSKGGNREMAGMAGMAGGGPVVEVDGPSTTGGQSPSSRRESDV